MTRAQSVRAIESLYEAAFGHDKGSGEAYCAWAADQGLCDEWDGAPETADEERYQPPSLFDVLAPLGVDEQEVRDAMGWTEATDG